MLNISKQKLYAGAKWSWTESVSGYPASLYDLIVYLKRATDAVIIITAVANGDDYTVEHPATSTSITSGDYSYQVRFVEKADPTNIKMYEVGVIHIYPDLATPDIDGRSPWMRIYENLMTAYEALSTKQTNQVTLYDGTNVTYNDLTDLLKRIHNAEIKAGLKKANKKTYVRFI